MTGNFPTKPRVSVVIPVYNGANYLAEAIDSALEQTYENMEIIVVNDGSTDGGGTEAVAKEYGNRIRYLCKENGGVSSALNEGVLAARGEFISWLSHDDAYPPNKVERQIEFLSELGDRAATTIPYGGVVYMDQHSKVLGEQRLPPVSPNRIYEALLCQAVLTSPVRRRVFGINGCTTLVPKKAFSVAGLFDITLRTTQDYDMWFRLNHHYDFVQMEGHLLRSRQHPEQGCRTMSVSHAAEVNALSLRALSYYIPGSKKWDLDLPKVAFSLKMSRVKRDAARKAMEMARASDVDVKGAVYCAMAAFWNPWMNAFFEFTSRM